MLILPEADQVKVNSLTRSDHDKRLFAKDKGSSSRSRTTATCVNGQGMCLWIAVPCGRRDLSLVTSVHHPPSVVLNESNAVALLFKKCPLLDSATGDKLCRWSPPPLPSPTPTHCRPDTFAYGIVSVGCVRKTWGKCRGKNWTNGNGSDTHSVRSVKCVTTCWLAVTASPAAASVFKFPTN